MNPQDNNSNRINYFEERERHAEELDNEDHCLWNHMFIG